MDIPDINWRDTLSVGAAIVSLAASALRLYDRRQERREQRRRAQAHRRAVTDLTPDALDDPGPEHEDRPDDEDRPDPDSSDDSATRDDSDTNDDPGSGKDQQP